MTRNRCPSSRETGARHHLKLLPAITRNTHSTLGKWVRAVSEEAKVPAQDAKLLRENERLRKENRILKEEREVLKKAAMFFAAQKP